MSLASRDDDIVLKVALLTSNQIRHDFLRYTLSNDDRLDVCISVCETIDGINAGTHFRGIPSDLFKQHFHDRLIFEQQYFSNYISLQADFSNQLYVNKGDVNEEWLVEKIHNMKPDAIFCFGSSLIKSSLIDTYKGRFINLHLGLSPYYRGAGTNVWPLINGEPEFVGATFMHIDRGIDTGEIIHQIQARICLYDTPHTIGNRLIRDAASVACDLLASLPELRQEIQINAPSKLYKVSDFDNNACAQLYHNFENGLVEQYLEKQGKMTEPFLIKNRGVVSQ